MDTLRCSGSPHTARAPVQGWREGGGEKLAVGGQWKAVGWMETCPKNAMSNGEGTQGRKWDPRGWLLHVSLVLDWTVRSLRAGVVSVHCFISSVPKTVPATE